MDYDLDDHVWDSREGTFVPKDDQDGWPGYIYMNDETFIFFMGDPGDPDVLKYIRPAINRKSVTSFGRIDIRENTCYNKSGVDGPATEAYCEMFNRNSDWR